jgi:hypothetical protein
VPERLSRERRLLFTCLIACACRHPKRKRAVPVWLHAIGQLLHRDEAPLKVRAICQKRSLSMRSCLIDGEVVCCDEKGVAAFQLLRHTRNEPKAFLYAFDLLELNGDDLRREPIEVRKATLAILRKSRHGVRLNEHLEYIRRATWCSRMPARWAWKESCQSGSARATAQDGRRTGSSSRTRRRRRFVGRRRRIGGGRRGDSRGFSVQRRSCTL